MCELILIRGLPGSGKSTKGESLKRAGVVQQVVAADDWFSSHGTYKFDAKFLPEAHAWCRAVTAAWLRGGDSVAVANTFTQVKEMQGYFDLAAKVGCKVRIIDMKTQWGNIHGVPFEALKRMADRWEATPEGIEVEVIGA